MKRQIGQTTPKIWIIQISGGFILQYIVGGALLGTIGTILTLVGLGNTSYFMYTKSKANKAIRILFGISAFIFFLVIYAFVGLFVSGLI